MVWCIELYLATNREREKERKRERERERERGRNMKKKINNRHEDIFISSLSYRASSERMCVSSSFFNSIQGIFSLIAMDIDLLYL